MLLCIVPYLAFMERIKMIINIRHNEYVSNVIKRCIYVCPGTCASANDVAVSRQC